MVKVFNILWIIAYYNTYAASTGRNCHSIIKMSGSVMIRLPFLYTWQKAKSKQCLPIYTLISTEEDTKATLKLFDTRKKQWKKIIISSHEILRIGSVFRHIEDNHIFFPQIPHIKDQPTENRFWQKLNFKSAWKRLKLFFIEDDSDYLGEQTDELLGKNFYTHDSKNYKIKILAPYNHMTIQTPVVPIRLYMIWESTAPDKKLYYIYHHQYGKKYHIIHRTKEKNIHFLLKKPGYHFLRVSTKDQKWQSKTVTIYIDKILKQHSSKSTSQRPLIKNPAIIARYPLPYTLISVQNKRDTILFSWMLSTKYLAPVEYIFEIYNAKNKNILQKITKKLSINLNLFPGKYIWFVKGKLNHKGKKSETIESMHYHLTLSSSPINMTNILKSLTQKNTMNYSCYGYDLSRTP